MIYSNWVAHFTATWRKFLSKSWHGTITRTSPPVTDHFPALRINYLSFPLFSISPFSITTSLSKDASEPGPAMCLNPHQQRRLVGHLQADAT